MKNLFKILLGLFLVTAAISCSKDDGATTVVLENQDVVFDITNFVPQNAGKNVFIAGKDNDEVGSLPECSDAEASYVEIMIGQSLYTLQLVTLNDKTETEVIKLAPGDYDINSFVVFDATGVPIWASPMMGSYYQSLWSLKGVGEPTTFTVDKFEKRRIEIDVLCYKPFQYEEFGFAWFAYTRTEIHTICFFGDICTKFYEEFHREGSPYAGQTYDGYDFAAMFYINIKDSEGNIVNDVRPNESGSYLNSNYDWQGVGAPLCIEYPDQVGVDETFTFEIVLAMPNGEWVLVHTGTFDDSASSAVGNVDGFGGSDGIFDFVVGNCSYDGNDASLELPAFIPLPETLDITIGNPTLNTYLDVTISNVVGGQAFNELYNGLTIGSWCGDLFNFINVGQTYTADVYSSLDLNSMPANYAAYGEVWNVLNWLINNHDLSALVDAGPYTSDDIQEGIWNLIHGLSGNDNGFMAWAGIDLTSGLTSVNPAIKAFEPTVGDWAMVLLDPQEDLDQDTIQLMIVQVDP